MESKKRNKRKYGRSVYQSLAMITQFGINMVVPIALCSFAGYYLARWLGTSYLMIILFFVGAKHSFLSASRIIVFSASGSASKMNASSLTAFGSSGLTIDPSRKNATFLSFFITY